MESNRVVFCPPPGWPPSLNGEPPPVSWQPGLELAAAPIGWVFYRTRDGDPAPAPIGAWTPTRPQLPVDSKTRPKRTGPILIGAAIGLVLAVVAAFVLWPRNPNLTTAQFAKLVDTGEIGGHLIAGQPYVDEPPQVTDTDPDRPASCEVQIAFGRKHVLRAWSGKTAEDASLWIELWDSPENLARSYELSNHCEVDSNASATSDTLKLERVYLRTQGPLTRTFSRGLDNLGVAGFTAALGNVLAGGVCGSGCGTEEYASDFAAKFQTSVEQARKG